jgi:hypothetical protein
LAVRQAIMKNPSRYFLLAAIPSALFAQSPVPPEVEIHAD